MKMRDCGKIFTTAQGELAVSDVPRKRPMR